MNFDSRTLDSEITDPRMSIMMDLRKRDLKYNQKNIHGFMH
jgi:hypothetical protein